MLALRSRKHMFFFGNRRGSRGGGGRTPSATKQFLCNYKSRRVSSPTPLYLRPDLSEDINTVQTIHFQRYSSNGDVKIRDIFHS